VYPRGLIASANSVTRLEAPTRGTDLDGLGDVSICHRTLRRAECERAGPESADECQQAQRHASYARTREYVYDARITLDGKLPSTSPPHQLPRTSCSDARR